MWISFIGPLQGGLHPNLKDRSSELVTSSCSNKRCLRPSHLRAVAARERKPKPRETYQGIGPRKVRPLSPLSIQRRTRAERLLRLKGNGYTNKAAAQAVGMSLKNAERIISGKVFPFLKKQKVLGKNGIITGRQDRGSSLVPD